MPPRVREQFEALLNAADEPETAEAEDAARFGPIVDVDKMWHALHFIVAGTAWEFGPGKTSFMLGGENCGEDVGYGPARLLSPREVATIAGELVPAEELRDRFDPAALAAAEIYPNGWDEETDDAWEVVATYYAAVRGLYLDAAAAGDAVVLWLD